MCLIETLLILNSITMHPFISMPILSLLPIFYTKYSKKGRICIASFQEKETESCATLHCGMCVRVPSVRENGLWIAIISRPSDFVYPRAQPVENRPAWEMFRQAAKHKRYVPAENSRNGGGVPAIQTEILKLLADTAAHLKSMGCK